MWKKGEQYHLSYNIKAVVKNIKWGRGEVDKIFVEDDPDFKNGGGEGYQVAGNLKHPSFI